MGSYCELYISNFPIATTKNEIDPFLLSIFQPNDLVIFDRKIGDRFQLLYGREDSIDEQEIAIQYFNTAQNLKDRLNVIGFTMKKVEKEFENTKRESLERLHEWIKDKSFSNNKNIEDTLKAEIELLRNSNLADFLSASKQIIKNGFKIDKVNSAKPENTVVEYLMQDNYGLEKFPYGYDQRTLLRALLEITKPDEKITYDITELVEGGYYESDPENIYEEVIGNVTYDYKIGDKFLILTEGSSDIQILKNSLELLYPHLFGYYSFMDFGISNASGSASSLVA
ncbi:HEPN/Toprim-associated domain-containing protein, partial [Kaistella carnis]